MRSARRVRFTPEVIAGAGILGFAIGCVAIVTLTSTTRDEALITIGIALGAVASFIVLVVVFGISHLSQELEGRRPEVVRD